jgi:hypothetical protein
MTFGCPACIGARDAAHASAVHKAPNDGLTATRRLTIRNDAMLARGRHPATGHPTVQTASCGSCENLRSYRNGSGRKVYHKCALHRLGVSRSAASDVRISWPACTLYAPHVEDPTP